MAALTSHIANNCNISLSSFSLDREKIEILQKEYDEYTQKVLEKFYLQPYPQGEVFYQKAILQDGIIEREVHGAMHAVRVSEYVQVVHDLNTEFRTIEVKKIFETLTNFFNCTEQQLIILTKFAGLYHDASREDEYVDRWDKQSGEAYGFFLETQLNLSKKLAWVFQYAIEYKDKPNEFLKKLTEFIWNNEAVVQACDYIRHLVHEADCLDIMRCKTEFYVSNLEMVKRSENNENFIKAIKELVQNVHTLIYNQGDMLNNCGISIKEDDRQIAIPRQCSGSNFSLKIKTHYEHASNVRRAVLKSFRDMPYFTKKVEPELLSDTLIHFVQAGFNPFIHGTNSSILAFLPRTNFEFLSPIEMVSRFQLAPMSGEINKGGLGYLYSDGAMCFGRLNTASPNVYTLDKIRSQYANTSFIEPTLEELSKSLQACFINNFIKINEFLILLCRAKQWGLDIHRLPLVEIQKQMHLTKQYFYLILCLVEHLMPNITAIRENASFNQKICNIVENYFTKKNLKDLILDKNINAEEIFRNPTTESLEILINFFSVPEEILNDRSDRTDGIDYKKIKEIFEQNPSQNFVRLFTFSDRKNSKYERCQKTYLVHYSHLRVFKSFVCADGLDISNCIRHIFGLNDLKGNVDVNLNKVFQGLDNEEIQSLVVKPERFQGNLQDLLKIFEEGITIIGPEKLSVLQECKPLLIAHLETLEERFSLMMSIFNNKKIVEFTEQEREWIKNPIPILLISEEEPSIEIYNFSKREFRLKKDCRFYLGKQVHFLPYNDDLMALETLDSYRKKYDLYQAPVTPYRHLKLGTEPGLIREVEEHVESHLNSNTHIKNTLMDYLYQHNKTKKIK